MDNLDLDIDNYDLDDILSLFDLSKNFDEQGLKRAYRMTLMTHPDKSHLDKKFFLFFTKAFKLLKQIHDFGNKRATCSEIRSIVYDNTVDTSPEYEIIVEKIKSKKDFNKWFNDMFERLNYKDEETDGGYDSWLRSNEGVSNEKIHNMTQMNEVFETQKTNMRALIKHNGIQDTEYSHGSNLARSRVENYSSDMFSKLQYEDLKRAHTETVVPVTHEDYVNRKHFNNQDDLIRYRKENETLLTQEQSKERLDKIHNDEHNNNIQRAFKMAKQYEQAQQLNNEWWSNLRYLTNK